MKSEEIAIGAFLLVIAILLYKRSLHGKTDKPLMIDIEKDCEDYDACPSANYRDERRGIRNNNPGNIRAYENWQGQIGVDEDNFVIFENAEYGIRAMKKILDTKIARGDDTITAIISQWAPHTENETDKYISFVSLNTGIGENTAITENDYPSIINAIIFYENGKQPYAQATIDNGIRMA
jgi:hypothetical protein